MAGERIKRLNKDQLRVRVTNLKRQLESQRELHDLIESLQVHQGEVRSQQEALLQTQNELEASRDQYAELYDFAPMPILTLGSDGVIQTLNLAAARLFGVDRTNAVGTPLVVFLSNAFRRNLLTHLSRCRRETGLVRSELRLRGRDGAELPVELISRRFQMDGRPTVIQVGLIDLTERFQAEEERKRADEERDRSQREEAAMRAKDEAKDRFLAVLSHELRTPLTPILLTVELLEATAAGQDPAALASGLAMIRRNAQLQARLVDDLLDVTRIAHGKLHLDRSPVPLLETLRDVAELCRTDLERGGIALELRLEGGERYICGDATRLRQIFWNLLKNAVQHTPKGGRAGISVESGAEGTVYVVVSDNGSGIDSGDLDRLFEAFEQSWKGDEEIRTGLGLGLTICRGLVEAHGGTIRAFSRGRNQGSTFTVCLPTCPPPAERLTPTEETARRGRRISVLLVEDHPDTAAAMSSVLDKLGFDVRLASTLEDGRRLARQPFDVLVSDVQLPDGSGLDLMREISANGPVKGVAISGFGSEKDMRQSREAGFERHLVKPVAVERLVAVIQSLVDGAGSPDP